MDECDSRPRDKNAREICVLCVEMNKFQIESEIGMESPRYQMRRVKKNSQIYDLPHVAGKFTNIYANKRTRR